MEFVRVKAGTFTMGCTAEQGTDCADNEKPAHRVTLTRDYYVGKYEVTQAQWRKVMDTNPAYAKNCDNCPVENISRAAVAAFLQKLNQQTGTKGTSTKGTSKHYRLPTEAEWEYAARARAARGGSGTTKYGGSTIATEVAWYEENSGKKTRPVGQKKPNQLGLYDMGGNVWEWCADRYAAYTATAATNPRGPAAGSTYVVRGGGWNGDRSSTRLTFRMQGDAEYIDTGLRLVLDTPDDTPPNITSTATASVAENTTGVVYTATATDDVSAASDITFSLAAGVKDNDLFSLSGADLSFKAAPDYEDPKGIHKNKTTAAEKNVYELELTATDAAGNASTKVVSITVTNVAEKPTAPAGGATYTDAHTGMEFIKVQAGTFTMGCTSEQGTDCYGNESPSHQVTLTKDYYMGKYEVTQAQWVRVMGSNPSWFTSPACDNCPVEQVSWDDVQNFITKLNAELVKNNPAEQRRYRLPTEAEWEYAARGGHKATSTKYAGSNSIGGVAWYRNNSAVSGTRKTHPVGGKAANELGLYDMSGTYGSGVLIGGSGIIQVLR